MKTPPALALLVLAGLCASCRPGATTMIEFGNVEIDTQIVSMPEDLALPLIDDLRDVHRVEGAYQQVQKLIAEKRATLVGWPVILTKSGQRAVIEQIDELRYATEYDTPGKTTTTETPAPPATPAPGAAGAGDNKTEAQPQPPPQTPPPARSTKTTTLGESSGGPTAFETRNIGVTVEVEPVVGPDGNTVDINVVPQHIQFLEWTKETFEVTPPAGSYAVEQPRFLTNKITTSMTFLSGERKLIGIFKATVPKGNVELFIMRVEVQKRKMRVNVPNIPEG